MAAALIAGLIYIAIGGWQKLFSRPWVPEIIAVALAMPFIFLMHRAVKGCWMGVIGSLVFAVFIGTEGGLGVTENLKHEGSMRREELTTQAAAGQFSARLAAEDERHAMARQRAEQAQADAARLRSERQSLATLTEAQRRNLHEQRAELMALREAMQKEGASGFGKIYLARQSMFESAGGAGMIAKIDQLLADDEAVQARAATLDKETAAAMALAGSRQAALEETEKSLSALRAEAAAVTVQAATMENIRHTLFAKADEWSGGNMNQTITILFWMGFSLMFTLNLGAGFWLAMVTVPDHNKAWLYRLPAYATAPAPESQPAVEDVPAAPDAEEDGGGGNIIEATELFTASQTTGVNIEAKAEERLQVIQARAAKVMDAGKFDSECRKLIKELASSEIVHESTHGRSPYGQAGLAATSVLLREGIDFRTIAQVVNVNAHTINAHRRVLAAIDERLISPRTAMVQGKLALAS